MFDGGCKEKKKKIINTKMCVHVSQSNAKTVHKNYLLVCHRETCDIRNKKINNDV